LKNNDQCTAHKNELDNSIINVNDILTLSSCWTETGSRSQLPSKLIRLPSTGSVANAKLSLQTHHQKSS